MGEYLHNHQGRQVAKLGTCEHFMYVRRPELEALRSAGFRADSMQWALDTDSEDRGAIFRFPWPSEDLDEIVHASTVVDAINRREPFPYYGNRKAEATLPREYAPEPEAHSLAQVRPNGRERHNVYASVPCPVGMMTTDGRWPVYIVGERTSAPLGKRTVVECAWCRSLFSLTQAQAGYMTGIPEEIAERVTGITEPEEVTPR